MAIIFAADDDDNMTAFYAALFSDAGYQVETAYDGAAVLDRYAEVRPDILVLDVDMPGGAGGRFLPMIKRVLQLGKPVIFVTGMPEKVRGLPATYRRVSVFGKPVNGGDLLEEVRRLLSEPEGDG